MLLLLGSGNLTRLVGRRHQGVANRTAILAGHVRGLRPLRAADQRRTSSPASPARFPGVVSTMRGLPRIKKEATHGKRYTQLSTSWQGRTCRSTCYPQKGPRLPNRAHEARRRAFGRFAGLPVPPMNEVTRI